ncbi:Malonyl-coenzyme A:anthocyanin 3-O-glucoside-6''-O-malonyltransferase [Dendrobium catenatum]|uniref:Malonyl-coenzyme A:anthocyanin 3-O-glucoside-6''-O-malonyltransferase n=1 Tax=Dendrobium catenatum TaxID=906689 RepID=A0A2I0VVA5_9ASPA|nr:Malonyl-coenzyme A:anthocyanin 3-O-glucoside-6''-O-malonyltransferase [Dendrobium catenatum]
MSPFHKLKVVENCRVAAAASSSPTLCASIPLTYFDLLFLNFPPVQRLFFYDLPVTKSHFLDSELPNLKHSLSLALRRFYPLAGSLIFPAEEKSPEILCSDSDSISLTVAVSSDDFQELSANHARAAERFRPLLQPLPAAALLSVQVGVLVETLKRIAAVLKKTDWNFSVDPCSQQAGWVTLFAKAGIVIGTTVHHAAADGSSYTHFMETWALIAKVGSDQPPLSLLPPPLFHRTLISDAKDLTTTFLKDIENLKSDDSLDKWDISTRPNLVRATFVLGPDELHRLGQRTATKCSPFALACGLVWASLARARGGTSAKKERFGFVTGCRARLRPAVPNAYFGNCLGICCVEIKREELIGRRGAAAGAEAIWVVIKGLEKGVFEGAERWIRAVREYAASRALTVAGSPKLGIYGVDFGWGRPRKVELVSVERTGAMSLAESREVEGGLEIGIALPANEMEDFVACFVAGVAEDE